VGLGSQSYWYDEAVTTVVIHPGWTHGFWSALAHSESTPPLFYIWAKIWSGFFGDGPVALRSISDICGVGAVLVAYGIGRELAGRREALISAVLVATNPALLWYSQEARAYSLFVLLGGLSVLLSLRLRHDHRTRTWAGWSIASALALTAHYYAGFVLVGEVAALAWTFRNDRQQLRGLCLACLPIIVVGGALAPLFVDQIHAGQSNWINAVPIEQRLGQLGLEWSTFNTTLIEAAIPIRPGGGACAVAAFAVVLLAVYGVARVRVPRPGIALPVVAGTAIPIALALAGTGGFYERNLLLCWLLVIVLLAIGLAGQKALGIVAVVLLCAVSLGVWTRVESDSMLQRPPWGQAVSLFQPRSTATAVVLYPSYQLPALSYYDGRLMVPRKPIAVDQLDVVAYDMAAANLPKSLGAFQEVSYRQLGQLALARYRTSALVPVDQTLLDGTVLGTAGSTVLIDPSGPRRVGR